MSSSPFEILPSQAEAALSAPFPKAAQLESRLRGTLQGEVHFDAGMRALYATDSSNYRQVPIGLVVPASIADVEATVAACREFGAPLLARGAGTSLAGQCCNVAVVLDFSRFVDKIVRLDPASQVATVEPGAVLDRVREAAEKFSLTFAPDPATHNRCTIGGMIGNNSCGTHSLLGGKTVDNVHTLDILLYDGTRLTVGAMGEEELNTQIAAGGRVGGIYGGLKQLRDKYAPLIRERFPRIPRRVSGYNLDELLPENGFHVARALVGSEGTCVTVLSADLRLVKSPQFRSLVGLGFPDGFTAADVVPEILRHDPIALEGFDALLVDGMRRKNLVTEQLRLLPRGGGFLLAEFGGDSDEEARAKAEGLVRAAAAYTPQPDVRLYSRPESQQVWFVRESALGAATFVPGEPDRWEGWEDAAVAPQRLGEYLRSIFKLLAEFGYQSPMYGHFGHGCVHLRINFDFKSDAGIAKYREFVDRAADLVVRLGGSLSGEHGDGQSRGALLEKMYGPELIQAFREFKRLWDPDNRMNPGKVIDAYQPQEFLRVNAKSPFLTPSTHFKFASDAGSFERATLRCVGVGACRKETSGTMCPSYMATRQEQHSTRGRAHLLWEMLQGDVLPNGWRNEQVREALDLCLACKACKSECPVSVDMATYKAEFLAHHYEGKLRPIEAYAFGFIDKWARAAAIAPGLANFFGSAPLTSHLAKGALHIHPKRRLPEFAKRTFRSQAGSLRQPDRPRGDVLLWADTFNNYFKSETSVAAHQVLTDAGFRVHVLEKHVCCGRPLYDFGLLDSARKYLLRTLDVVAPYLRAAMPVVVLEPSCATVFRDELVNLLPDDARGGKLRENTYLLSEFLVKHASDYKPPQRTGTILVQGHCHHQAVMKMKDEVELLKATGAEVRLLDSGCCGMAGPFGFEKQKYDISQKLAERVLLPAVRAAQSDTVIVADGFSCREQIAQSSERRGLHLAEVLALADRL